MGKAKTGRTLRKIEKLLGRHVEQYDRLLGLLEVGARRALEGGDGERPSEADLHFRMDQQAREERAFRDGVLAELKRHNELLASLAPAPKKTPALLAPAPKKQPPKSRAKR